MDLPPGARLVHLAGVSWDSVAGTDRHLAQHLARTVPVVWVDPPVSVARVVADRNFRRLRRLATTEEVAPGVTRVNLLTTPYPSRRGWVRLAEVLPAIGLRRWFARRGLEHPWVLNTSPHLTFDVLPRATTRRRLYYATDDFVAGAALFGLGTTSMRRADARRVHEADVLAAVTPQLVERWGTSRQPVAVLPNGVDVEAYVDVDAAALPSDVDLPAPVAGLLGQLSARLDLSLLESVADTGVSLLLVGPVQAGFEPERFAHLVARDNVVTVGAKPFEELGSYLRLMDVGLTPYVDSAFNQASFPLKTLEYLAAGRPVVSTPLPAVETLATQWIETAADPPGFAAAALRLALQPRTPEAMAARREVASMHSWDARATSLLTMLGIVPDGSLSPEA